MKSILIVTYHFAPLNVAASHRAVGFAKHLPQVGWKPTVLTFNWGELPNIDAEIVQIPQPQNPEPSILYKIPVLSSLKTWWSYKKGKFDWHVQAHAKAMQKEMDKHLQSGQYDLIMGIFSPHFHFEQCAKMSAKHKVPFIMDFRDLWHNQEMSNSYKFGWRQNKQHNYIRLYWKRWSQNMLGFSTVAESFKNKLSDLTNKDGTVVLNGHDGERPEAPTKFNKFTIGHFGNLLPTKDIMPFLEGVAKFHKSDQRPIRIEFYAANSALKARLTKHAQELEIAHILLFKEKVERQKAIELMGKCHLLYYPPILGHHGMYSAKIFDYLGSGSRLLISPDDGDVVANLIISTGTGEVVDTSLEVSNYISRTYDEWQSSGTLPCPGNSLALAEISRKNQVEQFALYLNNLIDQGE